MLTEISVHQFALIEHAQFELESGMTVFSGETGAGKSMLLDAFAALFGSRANANWVRHGAKRAEVSAILQTSPELRLCLKTWEMEHEEELILRRVINQDGRSRAYINGIHASASQLRHIGACILDFHGQHQHQQILQPDFQATLLDHALNPVDVAHCQECWAQWKSAQQSLQKLQQEIQHNQQQEHWLRTELANLQALNLSQGIMANLDARIQQGRHYSLVQEEVSTSIHLLEENTPNVRSLLAQVQRSLQQAQTYRPELQQPLELISQMELLLNEICPELHPITEESFDAQALETDEILRSSIQLACQRHHKNADELLELIQQMEDQVSSLDTAELDEKFAIQQLAEAEISYRNIADKLHQQRQKAAKKLCLHIRPWLDKLALQGLQLRFDIEQKSQNYWKNNGWDHVQLMMAANVGEPFKPLAETASGGELSRLSLALKGCGAAKQTTPIAIFDEVDVGVGGETAWHVGQLLRDIAKNRQVLVVSHLAQVASCAQQHIFIHKKEQDGRTISCFKPLDKASRKQEITRMAGLDDPKLANKWLKRGQAG